MLIIYIALKRYTSAAFLISGNKKPARRLVLHEKTTQARVKHLECINNVVPYILYGNYAIMVQYIR